MTHNWIYWEDFNPEDYLGFVYKITNLETGKFYIGKKSFWLNKKHKLTKKQLSELKGPGRKPTHEVIKTESNWRDYWGSSEPLLKDIKQFGSDKFQRQILVLCKNKKQLTYFEIHYQCVNECLINSSDMSYNDNILGKFFRKDLLGLE